MVSCNREKHQWAFCASAVGLLIGLSFIAIGATACSVFALVVGGVLTFLSMMQAVESYSFLQKDEKPAKKLFNHIRDNACGEPPSKLFIERVFDPFCDIYNKLQQSA
ncbi:WD_0736 family protein [Wolbachia endosymbiont of Ctenocephalides felis wCfeT]|uniref:WD_0736 family protein n=1 Tax=Wolbachia endosymbiont of Ctenocephalides felis wCfeT TaxID=2732593 RepID=UPI0014459B0E|nr:hypothetical protein [Wolbachia endosymbiont of Ctenocephalides felis wCfeT]